MTVRLDTERMSPKQVADRQDLTFLQWPDAPEEEDSHFSEVLEDARHTRERFNRALEAAEDLLSDERFSEEGHRQRLNEPEGDLAKHRSWIEEMRERTEKRLRQVEEERSRLSPFEEPDASDSRAAIREREVRDHLREMDTVERREMLVEAAENGRDEVVRAALDAPGGFSPVGDATRELVEKRALEARHGDEVRELDEREQNLRRLHRETEAAAKVLSDPDTLMSVAEPPAEEEAA